MKILKNVDLVKKANIYFDGSVTSRTYLDGSGNKKSLGVMMSGEYTFGTVDAEHMEIISGRVEVLLSGLESNWELIEEGGYFEVPANSSFDIKVLEVTDYCCTFIQ
jgi:uncharacterized protein YaiE (UPF0345 family)